MKNCSPTIKKKALYYIAKYRANYRINNNIKKDNCNNINILYNFFEEEIYKTITINIRKKLIKYIEDNDIEIENKIDDFINQQKAIEINKLFCNICSIKFNTEKELQHHCIMKEHIKQENNNLKKELKLFEHENIKITELLNQKNKQYNKLLDIHNNLKLEYNKLEYNIL